MPGEKVTPGPQIKASEEKAGTFLSDFTFSQTRPLQCQWHVCRWGGLSTVSTNTHSIPGDHQGQVQGCVAKQVMSLWRCAKAFPLLKGQLFHAPLGVQKNAHWELYTKQPICMISLQEPWGMGVLRPLC